MNPKNREAALSRAVDHENFLTNRIIMIITPIVGIIGGVYSLITTQDLWLALQAAFWFSAATFSAWSLSRELDHDNDWSAFLAVAISVTASFLFGFPALAIFSLAIPLLSSRMVSRIVGIPATLPESVIILTLGILALFFDIWLMMLVTILAFMMDASLSNPTRHQWGFAAAGVALLLIRAIMGIGETSSLSSPYLITAIVLSIGFALIIISTRKMRTQCDIPAYTLDVKRVRAAMSLGLLAALIAALWGGDTGMISTLPLWSALAATIIYRIPLGIRDFLKIQQRQAKHEPSH
jgi:hypothetical protein